MAGGGVALMGSFLGFLILFSLWLGILLFLPDWGSD
jgi:hypothetical protein